METQASGITSFHFKNTVKVIDSDHIRVRLCVYIPDIVVNYRVGERFSAKLGLRVLEERKRWTVNGQVAGSKTSYAGGLTFITIWGAGHMAPQWRPEQTAHAVLSFLRNQPI